jgi:hypothetical protein
VDQWKDFSARHGHCLEHYLELLDAAERARCARAVLTNQPGRASCFALTLAAGGGHWSAGALAYAHGISKLVIRRVSASAERNILMNAHARAHKIVSYGNAHSLLIDALQQFPRGMWHFKPAPDQWSIHEILIHITDSEANGYIRCRKCIAEPRQAVMAYNEHQWAVALHYQDQRIEEALDLFKWLRLRTYQLIQSLPDSIWSHTVEHTENGTMSLDDWLDVYEHHIPQHIEQMKAVYAAWLGHRM